MILCQWGISLILSLLVITYKKTRKENPLLPPFHLPPSSSPFSPFLIFYSILKSYNLGLMSSKQTWHYSGNNMDRSRTAESTNCWCQQDLSLNQNLHLILAIRKASIICLPSTKAPYITSCKECFFTWEPIGTIYRLAISLYCYWQWRYSFLPWWRFSMVWRSHLNLSSINSIPL